jgi:hypothetical protein
MVGPDCQAAKYGRRPGRGVVVHRFPTPSSCTGSLPRSVLARQVGGLRQASCSRRTAMICSSVNLTRFIVRPSSRARLYSFLKERLSGRSPRRATVSSMNPE